ncbi:MAG: di-trans,poly-cis-decaprenylcistransferase [Myxococcales bacterium]|nr:di-trans,poly-cis-decaprenylcistransferase [Myxococcales bacterium]
MSAVDSPLNQLLSQIDPKRLPRHVGIIMDGNGRWAESRGQDRLVGHREGSRSVRAITRLSRKLGLQALTLYAFSSQNWQRPAEEVAGLMALLREYLVGERDEIMDNDIRLTALGDLDKLPRMVREPLDALMAESAGNGAMTLSLALSYGGREELLMACRALLAEGCAAEALDEARFEQRLYTAHLPQLDLVIRTSGELRLSNFLLWQSAYAEMHFTDILWPDFREEAFAHALLDYQARERRCGKTGAQVRLVSGE